MSKTGPHVEVLGLGGESLLILELVFGVIQDIIKVLQQHGHDEERLLPGKGASNAGPHASTKRFPAVGVLLGQALKVFVQHALRLELVGRLSKDFRVHVRFSQ